MRLPIEGGCLCGAVRYRIDAAAGRRRICHCATCRRAAGAQSVAWATVAGDGFAFVAGRAGRARLLARRGPHPLRRPAAPASPSSGEPDSIDVTLASLDDPEAMPPRRRSGSRTGLSWEPLSPALPGFPTTADRTDGLTRSTSAARIQSTTTSAMRLIRATRASSWWRTR